MYVCFMHSKDKCIQPTVNPKWLKLFGYIFLLFLSFFSVFILPIGSCIPASITSSILHSVPLCHIPQKRGPFTFNVLHILFDKSKTFGKYFIKSSQIASCKECYARIVHSNTI